MHKRIKELAKEAGLKQTKWADVELNDVPVRIWQESLNDPGALDTFAKLIIQECCDIISKESKEWLEFGKSPPDGQEHAASSAIFAAFRLNDTVASVKDHFRVEK